MGKERERDNFDYSNPVLGTYFNELGRHLLSREEEIDLAKKISEGKEAKAQLGNGEFPRSKIRVLKQRIAEAEKAKKTFAVHNLALVIEIAKHYRSKEISFADLIQEGNIGLLRAVEKFDWRRGNRFSTMASWWIRQAIQRATQDKGGLIRVPTQLHVQIKRAEREALRRTQEEGRTISTYDVASKKARNLLQLAIIASSIQSLDMQLDTLEQEGRATLGDFIPSEDDNTEEIAGCKLAREEILEVLKTLSPKERKVLELRFGFDGNPKTLSEVGQEFGVSRERIRQIEAKAKRKLRHPTRARKLKGFV